MTTYRQITEAMRDLDRKIAPGSESIQMQDYTAAAHVYHGPWSGMTAPADFASFWLAVARQDYAAAEQHGDINLAWVE